MSGPWLGGITVRRMERGQTPVVDFLCIHCWHHHRVTGRPLATDYLNSQPLQHHQAVCPAREDHR